MTNFEETAKKMLEEMKKIATTETVIGQQFQLGDYSCVPIIKVSFGFGHGGASGDSPKRGKGASGGAGGGLSCEPIAFLVTKDDQISIMNVGKGNSFASLFEKMPGMVEKMMDMKNKDKENDNPNE